MALSIIKDPYDAAQRERAAGAVKDALEHRQAAVSGCEHEDVPVLRQVAAAPDCGAMIRVRVHSGESWVQKYSGKGHMLAEDQVLCCVAHFDCSCPL